MKRAVITMGLPASGKSTGLKMTVENLKQYIILDSDKIKESHPMYDPKNPEDLHEWSKWELEKRIVETVENGSNLIIDTTGTNIEKMFRYLKMLKSNGYIVTLLYMEVSKETSIKRNALRERNVPSRIINEKAEVIDFSWNALKDYFDYSVKINNDGDR